MKTFHPSHLMISAFVFATATIPGTATAAISGETKALFDTVKDVFKDGATLFLTLFGVVFFLAAAFWIFSSIAQWTKGRRNVFPYCQLQNTATKDPPVIQKTGGGRRDVNDPSFIPANFQTSATEGEAIQRVLSGSQCIRAPRTAPGASG